MNYDRLADRADHEVMRQTEYPESWVSPPSDFEDLEMWWQALRAQVQLPDAAD